jgi:hypothetical protein
LFASSIIHHPSSIIHHPSSIIHHHVADHECDALVCSMLFHHAQCHALGGFDGTTGVLGAVYSRTTIGE